MKENFLDKNINKLEVVAVLTDFFLAAKQMTPVATAISLTYKNLISPVTKRENIWIPKVIEICRKSKEQGFWVEPDKEEEFISYLLVLNQNAIKTHQDQKIELFEHLLKGYLKHCDIDFDINLTYLNLTDRLTLKHIEILKNIYDSREEHLRGPKSYDDLYSLLASNNLNITIGQFRFILDELSTFGLIFKSKNISEEIKVSSTRILALDGPFEDLPLLVLTDFAKEYVDFLFD